MPAPTAITYSDGKTKAAVNDHVYGKGPNGHAVAGKVDSVDLAAAKVRVVPYVQDAIWCNASDMTSTTGQPKS